MTQGEFKQFLGIARGSLLELETQVIVAASLQYIDGEKSQRFEEQIAEVARIINGLIRSLETKRTKR